MAEFAANNQSSASTGVSPFFANKGFQPRMCFQFPRTPQGPQELDAKDMAHKMKELFEHLTTQIRVAQDRYETTTNKSRTPAPDLKDGDQVFLAAKKLRTERNSTELDWKKMGAFPVTRVISPYAYELKLSDSMKIHPVFHISLLELAPDDPLPGQHQLPPPPVIIEEIEEYAVEEVLDSRVYRKEPQYLIRWMGYPQPSWEPAEYHRETSAISTYHEKYPAKPGPWFDEQGREI
jgi:hypothetical protein